MSRFETTNCEIRTTGLPVLRWYAACTATGCTWVGPLRAIEATAKRDAVRHHEA